MAYLVSEFKPTPDIPKVWQSQTGLQIERKMFIVFHSNILIILKIAEFRTPTPQDVREKGREILKLPPVCNCYTLTMTKKMVVIINSLKYQKLRKFYYMEWNFLYQITAVSRNPDEGTTAPRSLFSLSSNVFDETSPNEKNSWVRHCSHWTSDTHQCTQHFPHIVPKTHITVHNISLTLYLRKTSLYTTFPSYCISDTHHCTHHFPHIVPQTHISVHNISITLYLRHTSLYKTFPSHCTSDTHHCTQYFPHIVPQTHITVHISLIL